MSAQQRLVATAAAGSRKHGGGRSGGSRSSDGGSDAASMMSCPHQAAEEERKAVHDVLGIGVHHTGVGQLQRVRAWEHTLESCPLRAGAALWARAERHNPPTSTKCDHHHVSGSPSAASASGPGQSLHMRLRGRMGCLMMTEQNMDSTPGCVMCRCRWPRRRPGWSLPGACADRALHDVSALAAAIHLD